jgi:hypothetical protein
MNASNPDSKETILHIGAEGGSLKIQRCRTPIGRWKFIFIIDESTLTDFLDEADQIDLVKKYRPVDTFEEAIQLMNKYPWREMQLISVHEEYAEFNWSEMQNAQILKRSKFMNASGQLTSAVAKSITEELNQKGYDVYYDHEKAGKFMGTIAVSIDDKLSREKEISQLDIAIVERIPNKAIALIEIEETTDNPKKLIGDIFAVLMGTSTYLPGGKPVYVGEWTTLMIIGKGPGHVDRNERIRKMANNAKSALGTVNSKIGNFVIKSFSVNDDLKKVLMEEIDEAIQKNA